MNSRQLDLHRLVQTHTFPGSDELLVTSDERGTDRFASTATPGPLTFVVSFNSSLITRHSSL